MKIMILLTLALALLATPAVAQVWIEEGDAGELPDTAQLTQCEGALVAINGNLDGENDVDMYCVTIPDPAAFIATTCGGTSIDTQLWLFDVNGIGISFDDDDPGGCGLQSTLTGQFVPQGDQYFLAISAYSRDAVDAAGAEIWADSPFAEERQPDGPGAPGPIAGWGGDGFSEGPYEIILDGTTCCGTVATENHTWGDIKSLYR